MHLMRFFRRLLADGESVCYPSIGVEKESFHAIAFSLTCLYGVLFGRIAYGRQRCAVKLDQVPVFEA